MPEYSRAKHLHLNNNTKKAAEEMKIGVTILSRANQKHTLGYCYLLKRAAYLYYLGNDFKNAESLLLEHADKVKKVTSNVSNHFSAHKNLLLFYASFDLVKAKKLLEKV